MKLPRSIFVVLCIFCLAQITNAFAQETGMTYVDRELDYLMSIWPGDYDNQEQLSFDRNALPEDSAPGGRFHAVITRVKLPALGENVLYVEESLDGDLQKIYQQRLYVLSADELHKAIRIKSYAFNNPPQYRGAGWEESKLAKLKIKELNELDGCDMLVRRDNVSFAGSTVERHCESRDGVGFRKRSVRISADQYVFNDQRIASHPKNSINSVFTPRVLERARWFACMVDVPKDIPDRSNFTQHYIKIHDQGGRFTFTHPDGREMTLLMRNTWSYGMQRKTFFIGVFEGNETGKLLVYSWGTPGADRIGMNPGYVRIQCDLDNARNVKLQHGLRAES